MNNRIKTGLIKAASQKPLRPIKFLSSLHKFPESKKQLAKLAFVDIGVR